MTTDEGRIEGILGSGDGVRFEPSAKRIRAYLEGRLVLDTIRPLLVWEKPIYPTYYVPQADVLAELVATGETRSSRSRGEAVVYDVRVQGATAPSAALRYVDSPVEQLRGLIRVDWSSMSEWLEEDEIVYAHPRDPYTRVDILPSSRKVRVEIDGVVVAESSRPHLLFETGHPTRYYLPLTDLRMDLFEPSPSVTQCPYKGSAAYWSYAGPGKAKPDIAWTYRTPLPESLKIAGLVSFYNERTDIYVDGVLQDRPRRRP